MTKHVSYDFRRWRRKLHDYEFALPGPKQKPPTDLRVDRETWTGITRLPDDVSLRTSDYHGRELRAAYKIVGKWWNLFDDISDEDPDLSPLREFIVSNYSECEASIFNALVGYYRQAGVSLRFALEAVLSGIYFSATPELKQQFEHHKAGDPAVGIPTTGQIRNAIYEIDNFKKINQWLTSRNAPEFLAKAAGCVSLLYDELTEFSHGRVARQGADGKLVAYSNADIWASNGPIYVWDQFLRWYDLFCATVFCCGAVARIYLLPSEHPSQAYLSAFQATMSLPLTKAARGRIECLMEYLNEAYRGFQAK